MPETVTLSEVVSSGVEAALEHVHTATVAIVDSYDSATQRARVISAVRRPLTNAAGEPVYEDFPPFDSVPVLWPRNQTGGLHGPLSAGDSVLLVFLQIGIGEWRQLGGTQDTADTRTHSDGYPVALAGIRPDLEPLLGIVPGAWELGHFGGALGRISVKSAEILLGLGASIPVALAPNLATEIAKLTAAINALITSYNAHTHAVPALGTSATILPAAIVASMAPQVPANYASTLVKAAQ